MRRCCRPASTNSRAPGTLARSTASPSDARVIWNALATASVGGATASTFEKSGKIWRTAPRRMPESYEDIWMKRNFAVQDVHTDLSLKLYKWDFSGLTGSILASWFLFNPNGPTACTAGFAEIAHERFLFYRWLHFTGGKTYLVAPLD